MRTVLPLVLLVLWFVAGLVACTKRSSPAGQVDYARYFYVDWAQDKRWDDGLAEVAVYAAERVVYNKPRQFEYTLITVKEDFNRAFNVKTDDYTRSDLFPVLKVNAFARIPTENYPYHYLTSLFFTRENPITLHKLTNSSQEWCGNTFKEINATGGSFAYTYHSYWDGQGSGQIKLDKNALFEDQLPYTLRSLRFAPGLTFQAPVYEFQQTSRATRPQINQATFTVTPNSDPTMAEAAWLVTVQFATDKQSQYWFAKKAPNLLLRQKSSDGRTLELQNVRRYAYWQR